MRNILPAYNSIPQNLGGRGEQRAALVDIGTGKNLEKDLGLLMNEYSVDYKSLHWHSEIKDGKAIAYFTLW